MQFRPEQVELLLQVARDASLGASFSERLEAITEPLAALVPSTSLAAILIDPSLSGPTEDTRAFFRNGDVALVREYAEHYMQFDPCPRAGAANPGKPMTLMELLPTRGFGRDPFTADFLGKQRIRDVLGFELPLPNGSFLSFGMHRDRGMSDFSAQEREILRLIGPDLTRAVSGALLRERLAAMVAHSPATPTSGALLLDAKANVLHADPGAQALCRRLSDDLVPFEDLVRDARELGGNPRTAEADSLQRVLPLEGGDLLVARASALEGRRGCDVLVVLELVRPGSEHFEEVVARRHGLTPREREVAGMAVEGLGNRHIAHKLGISPVTVGVHLSSVYRKTGVNGRTELARLMSGGAYG